MGALQYISTSALSLTLSGNTGVGPFLTLFIIGIIEKSDPNLLAMEGWVEKVVASWPAIVIFGILTILEFVGKCVPVVDAAIDSVMTFVVPIFSILGSMSSWGLFTVTSNSSDGNNDNMDMMGIDEYDDIHGRRLEGESSSPGGFLIFLQVCLCLIGIVLALLVHLCKLLLRLMGEGCCTCCITTLEYAWIMISVTVCIFIVPIAIGAAICLMVAAGFGFKSWWEKRQKKKHEREGNVNGNAAPGVAAAAGAGAGAEGGTPSIEPSKTDVQDDEEQQGNVPSTNPNYVGEATTQSTAAKDTVKDDIRQPLLP